jgi:GNAT superfamily N-acetyltransferase
MLTIREATEQDVGLIIRFIQALADYEQATPDEVKTTEENVRNYGFGPIPRFHCIIAEWNTIPAGFSLYFYNYSTWEGKPGIYLEDLFVLPEYRKHGIGKALLRALAQIALQNDCTRLVWQVLDWNELAINFYKSIGARCMSEWDTYRMEVPAMKMLLADE